MTSGTFSVLVQKASRGPQLFASSRPLPEAQATADEAYRVSKQLNDLDLAPTGIAFLLVADAVAQRLLAQNCVYTGDAKDILFQWGSY